MGILKIRADNLFKPLFKLLFNETLSGMSRKEITKNFL